MADMTKRHYQLIADVVLEAKFEIEELKDRWADERGGEHEMTSLQQASYFSAERSVWKLGRALRTAFKQNFSNFNEDKFMNAIDLSMPTNKERAKYIQGVY